MELQGIGERALGWVGDGKREGTECFTDFNQISHDLMIASFA